MERIKYLMIRVSLMEAAIVKMNLNSKNYNNLTGIIIPHLYQKMVNILSGNLLKINNILNKETARSQTK
jgi:hypothetical protein